MRIKNKTFISISVLVVAGAVISQISAQTPAVNLTQTTFNDRAPRWSPDGSKIVYSYVGKEGDPYDIFVDAKPLTISPLVTNFSSIRKTAEANF